MKRKPGVSKQLPLEYAYLADGQEDKSLKFLRRDGAFDVYLDLPTGREVYVGRTDGAKSEDA